MFWTSNENAELINYVILKLAKITRVKDERFLAEIGPCLFH